MSKSTYVLATIKKQVENGDLESYDGSSISRFLNLYMAHPHLRDCLNKQLKLNKEWVKKATNSKIYFIVNDLSWKTQTKSSEPNLRLGLIGPEKAPTISIDL